MTQVLTGNEATAMGTKLARVDVIAACLITPQAAVEEELDEFVADGELDVEFYEGGVRVQCF